MYYYSNPLLLKYLGFRQLSVLLLQSPLLTDLDFKHLSVLLFQSTAIYFFNVLVWAVGFSGQQVTAEKRHGWCLWNDGHNPRQSNHQ